MRITNIAALAVTAFLAGHGLQDTKILPSGTVFEEIGFRVSCEDMQTIRISDQDYFERMDAIELTASEAIEVCEKFLTEQQGMDKLECTSIQIALEGVPHYKAEFLTEHVGNKGVTKYRRWLLKVGCKGKRVKTSFIGRRLPGTVTRSPMLEMDNGMLFNDITLGDGAMVRRGSTVRIDFVLSLLNGTMITNTHDQDESRVFKLEEAEYEGLAAGLLGMRANGKRKIVVPPALGYGRAGFKDLIPANATLVLDVVLRSVD